MTKQYRRTMHCPECGNEMTTQPEFARWVNTNPNLDSIRQGLFVMDSDWWFHRYKTQLGREFQCLMMVEIKTNGAEPDKAQQDTLWTIDQCMRNRRQTPTNKIRHQAGRGVVKTYSQVLQRFVTLRAFGVHLLSFDAAGPISSHRITWDKKVITIGELEKLLVFDLDPDTLAPMNWRSHHLKRQPMTSLPLFDCDPMELLE